MHLPSLKISRAKNARCFCMRQRFESLHVLVHCHQRLQSLPAIPIAAASGPLEHHGTLGLHSAALQP